MGHKCLGAYIDKKNCSKCIDLEKCLRITTAGSTKEFEKAEKKAAKEAEKAKKKAAKEAEELELLELEANEKAEDENNSVFEGKE